MAAVNTPANATATEASMLEEMLTRSGPEEEEIAEEDFEGDEPWDDEDEEDEDEEEDGEPVEGDEDDEEDEEDDE